MTMLRDKIKAALIGGAIGDAWGKPVETWSPDRIQKTHQGGVHGYVAPIGHKWFKVEEHPPGTTTDDTQLHVATMVGLITAKQHGATTWEQYMDEVAQAHLQSMRITTAGAGDSTRLAILSLGEGKTWRNSGVSGFNEKGKPLGTGNGVPMRIGALSAFYSTPVGKKVLGDEFEQACIDFSSMTHATRMSAEASIAHAHAVAYCLRARVSAICPADPKDVPFSATTMLNELCLNVQRYEENDPPYDTADYRLDQLQDCEDKMSIVFQKLKDFRYNAGGDAEFIEVARQMFNGSCYLYHSMPFTYAFFLRYWPSIAAMDQVINAGGDTDTNGKMVGEMLGALHGMDIFEHEHNNWTLDGLVELKSLTDLAELFCDTFGVE